MLEEEKREEDKLNNQIKYCSDVDKVLLSFFLFWIFKKNGSHLDWWPHHADWLKTMMPIRIPLFLYSMLMPYAVCVTH